MSPTKKKVAAPTSNLSGLARVGYMYLAAFLGLVAFAVGSAGLINVFMETVILPPAMYSYGLRDAIPAELNVRSYAPGAVEINKPITMAEAQAAVQRANEKVNTLSTRSVAERNRALSLSIVFVLVGGAVYFGHRKETLTLVQSKAKGR